MENLIENVSDTALWVAFYRARETEGKAPLFRDPFARALAGEKGRKIAGQMKGTAKYTAWMLSVRTFIIDEFIRQKVAGGVDMVLNLGAGLDSRPYRMELPAGLQWVEVDFPALIEHKEKILGAVVPHCRLERVSLDLGNRKARQELFSRLASRGRRILVLTEGVVPYLSEIQVEELAADLRAHPNFRYWIAEYFSSQVYKYLKSPQRMKKMKNAPFQFFPEDWMQAFKSWGWVPEEIRYMGEEGFKLGREMPMPWWVKLISPFFPEDKKREMRRGTAYVIFKLA